jgi:hypothetical protein
VGEKKPGAHSHGGPSLGELASITNGGFAMDPDGFAFGKQLDGLPTDVTVLAGKADVVFENGTRADIADGVYLHHVISMLGGKSQGMWVSFCPAGALPSLPGMDLSKLIPSGLDIGKLLGGGAGGFDIGKLLGGGAGGLDIGKLLGGFDLSKLMDVKNLAGAGFVGGAVDEFTDFYTTQDGKMNSGYYIPQNIKAQMSGEIINYRKEPQQVYIQFDLEYVPGHVGGEAVKTALSVEGTAS